MPIFLLYAKFMHFGALQYFSLLNLNWNISYFIFFAQMYRRVKCKEIETILQRFHAFWRISIFHYAEFMHFGALQYFSLPNLT